MFRAGWGFGQTRPTGGKDYVVVNIEREEDKSKMKKSTAAESDWVARSQSGATLINVVVTSDKPAPDRKYAVWIGRTTRRPASTTAIDTDR